MNWLPSLTRKGQRDSRKSRLTQHGELAISQAESQDGQIYRLRDAGDRIARSGRSRPRMNIDHQHRHKRDGQDGREADGQRLGPGQRPEHAAFLRFEQEDRKERNNDDEQRKEERRADLLGGVDEDACGARGSETGVGIRLPAASARWR